MTSLNVLHARDYLCMPWKNGGGITTEITRDNSEDLSDFGWRISIADIQEPGAFSYFLGYQRIITVLQGEGMTLVIDNQNTPALHLFDTFAFDGASTVTCELLDGAIRDFNLIYAPQKYRARLQWFKNKDSFCFYSQAKTVLIFSADEAMYVQVNEELPITLAQHDTLRIDDITALNCIQFSGCCCVIELTPLL